MRDLRSHGRKILPYLAVMAFAFYALPWFIQDTGSGMLVLLIGIPLFCWNVPFVYGVKHSFFIGWPIGTAVLFLPTVFLFYNSSAMVYVAIYGVMALLGNIIGALVKKLLAKASKPD